MAIPGTIQFPGLSATPSPPPTGSYVLYTKTDNTLNIEDSLGNVYTFGATDAITNLTGDVSSNGPGSVHATIEAIQGNAVSGTTGTGNVVFSASPTLTGTLNGSSAVFSSTISASNFSGSSSGTNTGDVTPTNTNSIDLSFTSGQNNLSANLNLSAASPDVGYIPALSEIKSDGLLVEVLAGLPVQIGTSNNIGSAVSASRSDHVHAITSPIVLGLDLTGYTAGTNTPITASDTLLQAFENLQTQISATVGAAITALTGDGTATGPGSSVFTLATVNSNIGSFGSSTSIPSFTVNAKGLITAASGNAVVAPAGTLSGTTLNSTVVSSSLTSVGTIGSGVWNGTTIGTIYGGTGLTSYSIGDILYGSNSNVLSALGIGSSGQILTVTGGIPSWKNPATSGTVTNVGLLDGSTTPIYAISGSPVTSSGTLTFTLENQSANTIFAGPISGSAAQPTFRALVSADIPAINLATSGNGGVTGILPNSNTTATSSDTASTIVSRDASGNFSATTITANLTGNVSGSAASFTGSLSGDVTGTQSATTVVAIQGSSVSSTAPTDAQILVWVNGTSKWTPESISGDATLADTGAITLSATAVTGKLLTGYTTGTNTPITATNSILTAFENLQTQISATVGAAITSLTGDVTATGPGASASTVAKIQGNSVAGTTGTGNVVFSASPTLTGTLTAAAANFSGAIAINDSSTTALTINSTSFIFDSVNNALGIGLQPSTSVMIDGLNITGASKLVQMTGYGVGSTTGYRGRFARGTSGSPSAVQSGDILSVLSGRGYGASQFAIASTGAINIVAGETFTNTSNLTYLQFQTTPTGSVTPAESMRVASTGVTLGPQSSSAAVHQINGGLSGTTNTITSTTYTVDSVTTDYILYTNSTSNAITITLPAPTNGRILVIEDKAGTAQTNNITVDPHASETINGKSSFVISQNYGSIRITSDGTNWFIQALPPNIASTITPVIALTESGGTTTINWATGNVFTLTLNANLTVTFSNQTAGQTIVVRFTNTASNFTVTWPSVRWPAGVAPTMSTGAVSDVYTFIYDGSNTYGSYVQAMS